MGSAQLGSSQCFSLSFYSPPHPKPPPPMLFDDEALLDFLLNNACLGSPLAPRFFRICSLSLFLSLYPSQTLLLLCSPLCLSSDVSVRCCLHSLGSDAPLSPPLVDVCCFSSQLGWLQFSSDKINVDQVQKQIHQQSRTDPVQPVQISKLRSLKTTDLKQDNI